MVNKPSVPSTHSTLVDLLTWAAVKYGAKPFLVTPEESVSFADIELRSRKVARGLTALGVSAGDRVTLWMENSWQWVASYFGILRIGATVNPINILLTPEEVDFIVKDCGAKMLLTNSDHAASLAADLKIPVIYTGANESVESVAGVLSFATLTAQPAGDVDAFLSSETPAAIGYTSGTTGRPRGAVLTHTNIVSNSLMTALMHGRTANDVIVSSLPCSHVYGNIVLNSSVAVGASLVLLPRFEEAKILENVARHRASMFEGVPTMYMKLLNSPLMKSTDLSSLRICTVGGQTMPLATMEAVEREFGCRLIELWGMTELAGLGTTHPHNGPRKLGSMGIPLPTVEVKVVSVDDHEQEVGTDCTGELVVRGPIVMQGYYANPKASEEVRTKTGWLRTGDLVRRDPDGYLYAVDRLKEVIINGGYNVYPAEVEQVIAQLAEVAMVAVAAAKDSLKGQVPKAFVVLKGGSQCDAATVIAHCKKRLASYKVPSAVEFVADLPKNSTGKILRRVLAESNL